MATNVTQCMRCLKHPPLACDGFSCGMRATPETCSPRYTKLRTIVIQQKGRQPTRRPFNNEFIIWRPLSQPSLREPQSRAVPAKTLHVITITWVRTRGTESTPVLSFYHLIMKATRATKKDQSGGSRLHTTLVDQTYV